MVQISIVQQLIKYFTIGAFLIAPFLSFGQDRTITISGEVYDDATGESMIAATVAILGESYAAFTNEYGKYSLTIPAGDSVVLVCSYVGYVEFREKISAKSNLKRVIRLINNDRVLEEIVIKTDRLKDRLSTTQMGLEEISTKTAKILPALFGEVDIIKTLQLKAGVSSGSEGSSGLFVRGGSGDQNLIMLDEATVYNANHLFGFFSTFNSDAVKDIRLYKGGFPAQYGGRLSSVIDVRMKDGNNQKFSGSGGLGLIASRLTLEGPIQKGSSSFIVSGRRTYVDLITNAINKSNEDNPDFQKIPAYNFYDLNAKVNTKLGEHDRLYLSGYFGKDVFNFRDSAFNLGFNWGNATGTVRWNHSFSPKLFANTTFIYSKYDYNISNEITGFSFKIGSAIENYSGKVDFSYNPLESHNVRMGLQTTFYNFDVGRFKAGSDDGTVSFAAGTTKDGWENAAYINDEFDLNPALKMNIGLRISNWIGQKFTDFGIEPRVSANYKVDDKITLKAGYARMKQYVHLVSTSGISLPTDVWYPSSSVVHPERSDQLSLGATWLIAPGLLFTNEYYYKWLKNQVDFRDNANLFINPELEKEFEFGKGYAYGTEVSLEKDLGKWTGWIAYTLAWVKRGGFPNIMEGRYFSPRFDRRHDFKFVIAYQLNDRWTFSGTWVYGSGDLAWLPAGRAYVQDIPGGENQPVTPVYGDRNSFRLPAYHRADLGIVYNFKPKWGKSDLTISIYNVYDRRNPYFLTLETEFKDITVGNSTIEVPDRIKARQVSLFPILPSITYNFTF